MLLAALPLLFFSNSDGSFSVDTPDYNARFTPEKIFFTKNKSMIALDFPGASRPSIERVAGLAFRANFLTGENRLQATIPTALAYRGIYPGIDAIWRGTGRTLKSEFVVAPHANAMALRMRYSGARKVSVAPTGALQVITAAGTLEESAPILYQVGMSGRKMSVSGSFRLSPNGTVRFDIGPYDRALPLYIDPAITYSTYMGGSKSESANAVATDASGNIYIAGWTDSSSFPTKSPLRTFAGSTDAFVAKLDPTGTQILWATFLGGSADDRALGLAVSPTGDVWVVGSTTSGNFPLSRALQSKRSGARDAFIACINSSGNQLLFSTYFGGTGSDWANAVAVDGAGLAYVAGETDSTNLQVRLPAQLRSGGRKDAFLLKLNALFELEFSTYLGGSADDRATTLAVSADGTPFVAGCTASTNFPVAVPVQNSLSGKQNVFVTRFAPLGSTLFYSTYLGGTNSNDCAAAIAIDSSLSAYVVGSTTSASFPTLGAFQTAHAGGGVDAFVTKLTGSGIPAYSTYLGGKSVDMASDVVVDSTGRAYVVGYTASVNFPTSSPTQSTFGGVYDGFVTRLNASGAVTLYSTYLGGSGSDTPAGIALNAAGDAIVVGTTTSTQFPTANPLKNQKSGPADAFIVKIAGAGN